MISLDDLKTALNIEGNDQDDLLSSLLSVAISSASDILGVETIEEREVEEYIHLCNPSRMFLSQHPIKTDSIEMFLDGEKVENTQYTQQTGKKKEVRFKDGEGNFKCLFRGHYRVKYTAGYTSENIPENLKNALVMLVSSLLEDNKNKGEKIKKYSIPDVISVEYQSTYSPYPPAVYTLLKALK